MKKLLTLGLLLCFLGQTMAATITATIDGLNYQLKDDQTATVTTGNYSTLKSVTIPDRVTYQNVTYTVTAVGDNAFNGCTELLYVYLPSTMLSLGSGAFYNTTLKAVVCYAETPPYIPPRGTSVFGSLSNTTLYVPIGKLDPYKQPANRWGSFSRKFELGTMIDGVQYNFLHDQDAAVAVGLDGTPTDIVIRKSFTYQDYTFNVYTIAPWAFRNQTSLQSVTIESGVHTISDYAFEGCTGIREMSIPSTMVEIGSYALAGLSSLEVLSCYAFMPPTANATTFSGGTTSNTTLYVKGGAGSAYATDSNWSQFSTIKNLIYSANINGILYQLNAVTGEAMVVGTENTEQATVIIPETVSIDDLTCTVTSIASVAFAEHHNLTSITLPSTLKVIGERAFMDCNSLESINLPESLTAICENAFYDCSALSSISVPEGVTTIEYGAFSGCTSLAEISLPLTLSTISERAFAGCTALRDISVPEGVRIIEKEAFAYCSALNSVELPSMLTSIGDEAFYCCSDLLYICFPEGVRSIGARAFSNCNSLGWVAMPSTLQIIGSMAFADCAGWMHVFIHKNIPPYIDSDVFSNGIAILDVKDGYVSAYQNATGWQDAQTIKEMSCLLGIKYEINEEDKTARVMGICDESIINERNNFIDNPNLDFSKKLDYLTGYVLDPTDERRQYTVTGFEPYAFEYSYIRSVVLPDHLTSIPEGLFKGNYRLTDITIPESVTSIGDEAFSECSLDTVVCNMVNPPSINVNVFSCYNTAILYVPAGSAQTYQADEVWGLFNRIEELIPGDVNGDSKVNVGDFIATGSYILGRTIMPFHFKAADINGDGLVNVGDFIAIGSIILRSGQ